MWGQVGTENTGGTLCKVRLSDHYAVHPKLIQNNIECKLQLNIFLTKNKKPGSIFYVTWQLGSSPHLFFPPYPASGQDDKKAPLLLLSELGPAPLPETLSQSPSLLSQADVRLWGLPVPPRKPPSVGQCAPFGCVWCQSQPLSQILSKGLYEVTRLLTHQAQLPG